MAAEIGAMGLRAARLLSRRDRKPFVIASAMEWSMIISFGGRCTAIGRTLLIATLIP
jgi:hypothetical protein